MGLGWEDEEVWMVVMVVVLMDVDEDCGDDDGWVLGHRTRGQRGCFGVFAAVWLRIRGGGAVRTSARNYRGRERERDVYISTTGSDD